MKKKIWWVALAFMMVLALGVSKQAFSNSTELDFEIPAYSGTNGGSVSVVGGVITGSNIPVYSVTGFSTGLPDGSTLIFPTDTILDFTATLGSAGGSIIINSKSLGSLMTGNFIIFDGTGPTVSPQAGDVSIFDASFQDTKGSFVLAFFGLSSNLNWNGAINLSFIDDLKGHNTRSGDVNNVGNGVPIPGSLLLFGSGIFGLAGLRRFRKG